MLNIIAIRNKCNNKSLRDSSLIHASEANFSHADIPGGEGGVCTRFPPELSGYLHIGHIKAAMLNEYYAHKFHGRLLLRFDDTNPTNEKGEFEEAIIQDLESVGIVADNVSHMSDYFDYFIECADEMIKIGKAYADNSTQEQMKRQRENMIESPNRNNAIEKNQEIWQEMKLGSEIGKQYTLRVKIDMKSKNTTHRDPVIFRCKSEAHTRTGDKYKAYPSYDFACPIINSKEAVTVALRTIEYRDRNAQYAFMQDALKIRPVPIQDFARLNFLYTEMSKRKLQKFVDDGIASGWNDPRFPTIQGIMRKGMTIPALRAFVLEQGPSKNITYQEWDKTWAKNRQVIDPLAPRYTAIECVNVVHVLIVDGPEQPEIKKLAVNKNDPEHGNKDVVFSKDIIIEQCDAHLINDNEEVTLMSWGNIIIDKIERDPIKQIVSPLSNASAFETVAQITHIDAGWDFGSGTGEQQEEFQEDFIDEPQQLEITLLNKKNKKYKLRKRQRSQKNQKNIQAQTQFYYNNQVLDNHLGPLFSQMNYPGPPGRAPDQSNTKLRSRQPTSRRQKIVSLTQTTPQSQTTPYPSQNQSSILNVDLMGIISNLFSDPKGMQHQQIAGEAAQVFHAPRETFSANGNVRSVASSTDSIVSGQVGVARTKPINKQTAPSTQLQGNPIRELKVQKKRGKTPVRGKAKSTNTSVVANLNQNEDQQRRQPGVSPRTVPTYRSSEQNKGGDSYTRNLSQDPNGGNITTSTRHGNGGKNNSLSGSMEIGKGSGIHTKRVFPSVQKRGQ
ncbi:MAG: putative Glutamate--tRNA ligase [Streblomastix strix]|uniref:glutamate--tRNA ligase n=1 Tax=Streblomastix strix TaxID=222440 RepID=A0A5J4X779_9EUKA|nr:MAG: putative Glutamate--tRNA ligase [Streblomastix strix]